LLQDDNHKGLQRYVQDLNKLYASEPALFKDDTNYQSFEWIDFRDSDNSVISFIRKTLDNPNDTLVFVCNLTPIPRKNYRIGAPLPGYYKELINSDSIVYGGSNMGNPTGGCPAEPTPWQGQPYSLNLILPPLSTLILKPE
jgi:1,4-alpha-glucan branching enzyme